MLNNFPSSNRVILVAKAMIGFNVLFTFRLSMHPARSIVIDLLGSLRHYWDRFQGSLSRSSIASSLRTNLLHSRGSSIDIVFDDTQHGGTVSFRWLFLCSPRAPLAGSWLQPTPGAVVLATGCLLRS